MQLSEFLVTASADHEEALLQWQEYKPLPYLWRIEGAIRKTQVETALIINDTETRLNNLIADASTPEPVRALAKKVLRSLLKLYEVEFYINLADPEVAEMFSAAQAYGILNLDEATRVTAAALYEPENPQPNATLHDVLLARDACPISQVTTLNGGYAVITVNSDCEVHSPRLLVEHNVLGTIQINCFNNVGKAGQYHARVPAEYLPLNLYVDNVYGAI